jgi:hypothetical protein
VGAPARSPAPSSQEDDPGTFDHEPPAAEFDAIERELEAWAAANPDQAEVTAIVTVPVFVHNFYDRDNQHGYLSADQIWDQLRWLNHSYSGGQGGAGTRFRFQLQGYERIGLEDHTLRFTATGAPTERTADLARQNRRGGKGYLNIWTGDLAGPVGVARFPWWQHNHPLIDGIWVQADAWRHTAAGSDCRNQGDTAVHEVGHWLGLRHTDVTPACGNQPNFMSYGRDAAMDRFTGDQAHRMSRMWNRYRN